MEIEDVKYKKKGKKSTRFKVVLSIFIILLLVLIGVALYFIIDFSKIWGDLGFNKADVTYDIVEDENVEGLEEVDYISGDVQTIGTPSRK